MDKRQDNADENSEAERKWNFSLNMKDEYTNTVYISQWFGDEKEGHPRFYEELKQLFKKAGIHFEELSKDNKITNDYWVRDFMPIQLSDDYFVKYKYHPDYLKDKYKHTITNSYYACKDLGIRYKETNIILDGGNVVQCGDDIILTDKVFSENNCDKGDKTLLKALHDVFGGRNIIIIPWTPSSTNDPDSGEDVYGHADGFVKYIGDKHILMSAHRMEHPQEAKEIVDVLKKYNYKVDEMDFSSVPHPHYDLNWAYINFLQVGRIIIMPKFNIEEDEIARKIIQNLFSNCTICQIEMTEIVKEGGALHCLTWNVKR